MTRHSQTRLRPNAGCCWLPIAAIKAANSPASCSPSARSTPSRPRTFPTRPRATLRGRGRYQSALRRERADWCATSCSAEAYREMPRLFVLADALHHGSMQAWALGATDTIARPFDARGILQRIRAAFPDSDGLRRDRSRQDPEPRRRGRACGDGQDLREASGRRAPDLRRRASRPRTRSSRRSSIPRLREWLTTVGCHHTGSYRHCLFVTGFAVAFAQHLGMREDDQRRLTRAALLHDVGKAFIPVAILDKPGALTRRGNGRDAPASAPRL